MLEITILKVEHQGTAQAKKLLPYIQSCDVFGPESSLLLEKDAIQNEANWEEIICSDMSRTMFTKYAWDMICKSEKDSGIQAYKAKSHDYLFLEKKPLWHSERYSEEERNALLQLHDLARQNKGDVDNLLRGNFDDYFEASWKRYALENELSCKRDRKIAQQLAVAETRIRDRYASLTKKEPLRYTIFLGLGHEPEKLLSLPVTVVQLGSLFVPYKRVYDAIQKREHSEELKRNTVIWQYITNFNTQNLQKLEQLSLPELLALLRRDFESTLKAKYR